MIVARQIEIPMWLAHVCLRATLHKGLSHKYVRRVPTGDPKRPWKYFYNLTGGTGHFDYQQVQSGAKFKVADGHLQVVKVKGRDVTVVHDETGHVVKMPLDHLVDLLHSHHAEEVEQGRAVQPKAVVPTEAKPTKPAKAKVQKQKNKAPVRPQDSAHESASKAAKAALEAAIKARLARPLPAPVAGAEPPKTQYLKLAERLISEKNGPRLSSPAAHPDAADLIKWDVHGDHDIGKLEAAADKKLGDVLKGFAVAEPAVPSGVPDSLVKPQSVPQTKTPAPVPLDKLPEYDIQEERKDLLGMAPGKQLELRQYWTDVSRAKMGKLTTEEAAIVSNFTKGSDTAIRAVERSKNYEDAYNIYKKSFYSVDGNKQKDFTFSEADYNLILKYAKTLEQVFEKVTPTPLTTYRGLANLDEAALNHYLKAPFVHFDATTSTSRSAQVAADFATGRPEKGGIVLKIHSKRGIPVESVSNFAGEEEILHPKGAKFRVISRKRLNPDEHHSMIMLEVEEV